MRFLEIVAIILTTLSVVSLISLDFFTTKKLWEKLFSRLNGGLASLTSFAPQTNGPSQGILKPSEIGFQQILKMLVKYFPDIFEHQSGKEIMGIVCQSSLQMGHLDEAAINPVSLWVSGEEHLVHLCSLNELRIIVRGYKQVLVNRLGLILLVSGVAIQVFNATRV